MRCYTELSKLATFEDRFRYLRLQGCIGQETFGFDRYLNQVFYRSSEWRKIRDYVILRDHGCDLGIEDREIFAHALIHHMNPITEKDIIQRSQILLDPEYLITTSHATHNAIHYSDESILVQNPIERFKNDTCPWRK